MATGRRADRRPRRRLWGTGLGRLVPYLLIAPSLLIILAVLVYPLLDGLRATTQFWRFGRPVADIGLRNYSDVLSDPAFRDALWVTLRFVVISVSLETLLGIALAVLVAREVPFVRAIRTTLIVPMIITPVVVGIVFRLMYASDIGLMSSVSQALGGGQVEVLTTSGKAFMAIVLVDIWEWTPLMFLIVLAGIQSLPLEPFEAARVDGASQWRVFVDHTLTMLRPVIAVAVVLRTIDAFTTFDQVFILTRGGPGTSTQLISLLSYQTVFKFNLVGYGAAMLVFVTLLVIAFAAVGIRVIRRQVIEP